jgi:tRNA threonylcarbamoyl adenosine modification protein YeaZ
MATAAALGQALGTPVYPVCTLDAIAAENAADSPLLVASDARRKEIYWATYDATGRRVTNPAVDKPADVVERIPSLSVERVAGNGATLYDLGLPHTGQEYPNPLGIAQVARDDVLAGAKPRPFVPLYLRRPDATEPGARKRVTTR